MADMTLGGVTLSSPSNFSHEDMAVARGKMRMYDGSLKETVVGSAKKTFTAEWIELSQADKDTIETRVETTGVQTLQTPEGATFSVITNEDAWSAIYKPMVGTTIAYDCTLTLEEV